VTVLKRLEGRLWIIDSRIEESSNSITLAIEIVSS